MRSSSLLLALLLAFPISMPRKGFAQTTYPSPLSQQAQEIKPPFGLEWGETEEHLAFLLKGVKAKIVEKRIQEGRDMWTVEGLAQANLKRTIFYFRGNGLVEVELQYQNPDWIESDYDNFMNGLRLKVENKFGTGKLIARSKTPQGDVVQTLVGYEWNRNNTEIQIVYFSAENAANVYRTVSLHYKAF
jgi:hypothetical protein